MTLNNSGKDYIAQQLGINNCFVSSGLTWKVVASDGQSQVESGGTALAVFRIITAQITRIELQSPSTGNYTASDLTSHNSGQAITPDDAVWISTNTYCAGQAPTGTPPPSGPTPVPTQLPPGMAGEYTFLTAPAGSPSILLDLANIEMSQSSTDYHFEMDDIFITNTSAYKVYLAIRVKLFTGAQSSCPSSGEVFDGMDRVSTTRNVRIKTLDPGEIEQVNGDFYQPAHILGTHTVCLIVHGSYNKKALEDEISYVQG